MREYYVYTHSTPDKKQVFYVGKGHSDRALNFRTRSILWKRKVEKHGIPIVDILLKSTDEEFILFVEQEVIDKYRKNGSKLVNLTDGGEGISGHKHSAETKKLMSDKKIGFVPYNKGKKIGPLSKEHKEKLKQAMKGRHFSQETREKLSISLTGKKKSNQAKLAMSRAKKGKVSNRKGITLSQETKLKISESRRK
ncbi:MAG: intron associated endonuclease 1 [Caudovirales sp. ctOwN3]|nr:MAG: intron associated endonuclease 1 [Caudovirales sp. ctOwN3]